MGLSAKEMQTALALEIKTVFDRTVARAAKLGDVLDEFEKLKPSFPPPPPPPKKKKKASKKTKQDGEHAPARDDPVAVLGKGQGYAQNGSDFIRAANGRGVYGRFTHLAAIAVEQKMRDDVEKAAKFPNGPPFNFTPNYVLKNGRNAGQRYPYVWEAHHILPGSAFYYESEQGPCFTYEQYRLLLQTDYNINHGHNIIMLPKQRWAVFVHALLQHPGDHPEWAQEVMSKLKKISKNLQELIDGKKKHEEIRKSFFTQLQDAEGECWKTLVALGRKVFAGLASGNEFVSPVVRYATKSGVKLAALS